MWVRIVRDRRFYPLPHRRLFVHFLTGQTAPIPRRWGEALIRNGDAVEIETPPRPVRDQGT